MTRGPTGHVLPLRIAELDPAPFTVAGIGLDLTGRAADALVEHIAHATRAAGHDHIAHHPVLRRNAQGLRIDGIDQARVWIDLKAQQALEIEGWRLGHLGFLPGCVAQELRLRLRTQGQASHAQHPDDHLPQPGNL
jgi:hypothetical protein